MKRVTLATIRTLRVVLMIALVGLSVPAGASKGGPKDTTMAANSLSCPFAANNVCPGDGDMATRTVTTTRSTAVPCQQADGTWGTAAINTACIAPGGVPGVESYGAVTNYCLNNTSPNFWGGVGAPTVTSKGSGWYEVVDDSAGEGLYLANGLSVTAGDKVSVRCHVKPGTTGVTTDRIRILGPDSQYCDPAGTLITGEQDVSCTITATTTASAFVQIRQGTSNEDTGSFQVQWCQVEKSSTPGRRCDSGGTATTCGADTNAVPTTGFPVARGELVLDVRPSWSSTITSRLFYAVVAGPTGLAAYIRPDGAIVVEIGDGLGAAVSSAMTWQPRTAPTDPPYRVRIRWGGGQLLVQRDGVTVYSGAASMPTAMPATAYIGSTNSGTQNFNGTISLVSIGEP